MTARLRIGLRLAAVGTLDPAHSGNVQGDEQVALSWKKYLLRNSGVRSVTLLDAASPIPEDLDVLIHFNPFLETQAQTRNILYLQNVFPPSDYPDGTVGVFRQVQSKFDGFLFTSRKLMQACADGGVIPFATDPETFYPQPDEAYRLPIAFVGNDIRGGAVNYRYFEPAADLGLVIYGNPWLPPLADVCRGKLPAPDLPKLYSSAAINLNAHAPEHALFSTVNLRIFDILACGGFVLSDRHEGVLEYFGDAVVCTDGYEDEWAKLVHCLSDPALRQRKAETGRRIVLENHTYRQRIHDLMQYLDAAL